MHAKTQKNLRISLIILLFPVLSAAQFSEPGYLDSLLQHQADLGKKFGASCDTILYGNSIDKNTLIEISLAIDEKGIIKKRRQWENPGGPDSLLFTDDEKSFILKEIEGWGNFAWPEKVGPSRRMVETTDIEEATQLAKNRSKQSGNLICNFIHVFSPPIYLRNREYCILYTGKISVIPSGELMIYRFHNGAWQPYEYLYMWME